MDMVFKSKKLFSVLLLIAVFFFSACKSHCKDKKTQFKIVYTRSYCGGARPTEEMLNALRTPKALANCTISFVNEKTGRFVEDASNEKGELNVFLETGNYLVRIGDNSANLAELPFKKDCKKLQEINLANLQIPVSGSDSIFLKIPCDPCDSLLKNRR
jgi:hypothetical protein